MVACVAFVGRMSLGTARRTVTEKRCKVEILGGPVSRSLVKVLDYSLKVRHHEDIQYSGVLFAKQLITMRTHNP
jgi:hypothetical protein